MTIHHDPAEPQSPELRSFEFPPIDGLREENRAESVDLESLPPGDLETVKRISEEMGRLLQDLPNERAGSVFRQKKARSKTGEIARDALIGLVSGYSGANLDYLLSQNESEANLTLASADSQALNLGSDSHEGVVVSSSIRQVALNTQGGQVYTLTELEFPVKTKYDNGTVADEHCRIISLIPTSTQ